MTSQPATTPPTGSDLTLDEMGESLTGFEEIAIEKHFERDVTDLLENRPTIGIRALIFTQKVREGLTPPTAKEAALGLPLKAVMGWYVEEEFEGDPDDPETEQGKDEPPSSGEPTSSPDGA